VNTKKTTEIEGDPKTPKKEVQRKMRTEDFRYSRKTKELDGNKWSVATGSDTEMQ